MGSLERRLEALEGGRAPSGAAGASEARRRMREHLDEIAAAKREGRRPSPWAEAISEAIERRRARETWRG